MIEDSELDNDSELIKELVETTYYEDGTKGVFVDIEENNSDKGYEEGVEELYFSNDGSAEELGVEEYRKWADRSSYTKELVKRMSY